MCFLRGSISDRGNLMSPVACVTEVGQAHTSRHFGTSCHFVHCERQDEKVEMTAIRVRDDAA